MYSEQIKQIAEDIISLNTGVQIQLFCKRAPESIILLNDATSFLLITCKPTERAFCVTNNIVSIPLCKMCTAPVRWISAGYRTYCSVTCKGKDNDLKTKVKNTTIKNWGVKNPSQAKKVQAKKIATCLKNHGVEWPQQNKNILEKSNKTNLLKLGVVRPLQNKEIYKKVVNTNIEKYGVSNTYQIEKVKQHLVEKYGVEYPFQSMEILNKVKQTNLEKYNVEYPFQSMEILNKVKQTNLEKYNVEYHKQKHMVRILPFLENYEWIYNEYVNNKKTLAQIGNSLGVSDVTLCNYLKHHNIIARQYLPFFSYKCIQWLESIMQEENIFIQHAQNIGEYRILNTRYSVDGYCKETNTIYEFHGDMFHGNPKIFKSHELCNPFSDLTAGELYQKTIQRENKIKELGYNLDVMWENDFMLLETQY
ncbi:MAG: DUF7487 domain-containing protein [Nitrosopumilaceae archaeon]